MGVIIGTLIFIAVVYNIVMAFQPSVQERLNKILDETYEELNRKLEMVVKLHNGGFRWTTDLLDDKAYADVYITVERKEDMNRVFWSKLYDYDEYKSGIRIRFMIPYPENEEPDEKDIEMLNNYAAMCDPRKVQPVISKIIKRTDKTYLRVDMFCLFSDEDVDGLKDKIEEYGKYEVIKIIVLGCFKSYDDFLDAHQKYRGIK